MKNIMTVIAKILLISVIGVTASWNARAARAGKKATKVVPTQSLSYPALMKSCPSSISEFLTVIERNEPVVRSQVASYKSEAALKDAFRKNPGFYDTVIAFYPYLLPEEFPNRKNWNACWSHLYQAQSTKELKSQKDLLQAWSDCSLLKDDTKKGLNSGRARTCLEPLLK